MALEASRLWSAQAEAKGLAFACDLEDCPGLISGDAARIRQVVANLLANALKFTAAGQVSLKIGRAGQDRYRIIVADTGIGIPADQQEAIFESFRQADTSTTRQFGGTGLGLSICRNLARAMGGDVTMTSIEGEGAVFTVDLPLIAVHDALSATPSATQPVASAADLPVDLLVVDRNPITRNMVKALFEPHFAMIAFAGSTMEAIERARRGTIACVIADDATVRSGDVLGDLTSLARAGDGMVALLWPIAAEVERDELLATGIDLVVGKPVTGAALVERLLGAVRNRNGTALVSQAA